MTISRALLLSAAASYAVLAARPALASDQPSASDEGGQQREDPVDENEITVVGNRLPQQVDTAQPPIAELNEQDIAAYGASSIADLVQQLAPEVSSGRGRGAGFPVILVNGMRISSFRELRSYPPEAIRKVEVLPEEVALRFGYSANQRVLNFILKDNFVSTELESSYGQPWDGGYRDLGLDATLLRIKGESRLNIDATGSLTSPLTEAERHIVEPDTLIPDVSTDPDPATQRTLVGEGSHYALTGNYTIAIGSRGGSLTFNAQADKTHELDRDGFNMVTLTDPGGENALRVVNPGAPLKRKNDVLTLSTGAALNQRFGDWDFQATLDASKVDTDTYTDKLLATSGLVADALAGTLPIYGTLPVLPSAGQDYATSTSKTFNGLVTMIGRPVRLPAGEVTVTVKGGYGLTDLSSSDTRNPGAATALKRTSWNTGLNLGLPLTSRDEGFLGAIGEITLNFNGGLTKLSDFGTLHDWTGGVTWNLTDKLGLQASYIYDESAPSLIQLGSPEVVQQGVPVYDFNTGQTVLVQTTTGGNPNLVRETDRDIKLSANWELPFAQRSRLQIEYFYNRSFNVASNFPLLTPDIEAAFPGRVTRDTGGKLVAIDQRPVSFAEQDAKRLRFGFNISAPFGKSNPATGSSGSQGGRSGAPASGARPQGVSNRGFAGGSASPGPGGYGPPAPAGAPSASAGEGGAAQGQRPAFDRSAFAALRERLCAAPAQGDATSQGEPDLSGLPAPLLERLKGPDGKLDPQKLAEFRQRVCSFNPQGGSGGQGQQVAGGPPAGGPPPGGPGGGPPRGGGGPAGFMMRGRGGDGRGRLFFNVNYTLELENKVLIAPGLPELDLLGGDALSGGGTVRHSVQLEGGLFYHGKGLRISGNYSGPSDINGTELPGSSDLHFGPLATLDLRLFIDLGEQEKLVEKAKFFKGSRVSLSIDNVFASYRKVTDSTGAVPLRYQPGLEDPKGRYVRIEFRKLF